jgi:hypothetical protein
MTTTIHVCSNHETLRSGIIQECDRYKEDIDSAIGDACALIDDAGCDCVSKPQPIFSDWNGGKFYRPGEMIGGTKWGYGALHVCTLVANPSPEICGVIDQAAELLAARLAEISAREDADIAEFEAEEELAQSEHDED